MIKLLSRHWIFATILIIGIFLRSYRALDWFMYSHDQDLQGWIVKDILENKHLRLIGQETTSRGVFIGPLFYYLLIPFYILVGMDPAGTLLLPVLLSAFTIFSVYYTFGKIFGRNAGLVGALLYAVSTLIIFTDREVAPTMPVMLWGVWLLYSLYLISKGSIWSYILIGLLAGLAWNISLGLVILLPLAPLSLVLIKQKLNWKYFSLGIITLLVTLSPYLLFESRHNFQQTKAIITSITSSKDYIPGTSSGLPKLDRVMQLVHRNTSVIFGSSNFYIPASWTFYFLVLIFGFLVHKNLISKSWTIIFLLWQVLYIAFFATNSINPSEYYLNGMNIIWILIYSLFVVWLLENKKYNALGVILLAFFVIPSLYSFFSHPTNRSGYLERKSIVGFITSDSRQKGYPCVSVSYITSPGNDFGYRYLFWLEKLHVNQPKSGSPVYTIVYPHSKVDRIDKSFGALGIVLPDYEQYNQKDVQKSCSGANSNLTDPMFGYTE